MRPSNVSQSQTQCVTLACLSVGHSVGPAKRLKEHLYLHLYLYFYLHFLQTQVFHTLLPQNLDLVKTTEDLRNILYFGVSC